MKSHPDIECYFIEHRLGIDGIVCEGDTLLIPGQEAYETILDKTIESLRWCMDRKIYDFVVRTNLSSVWNFQLLMNRLGRMPTTNLYSGEVNWGRYVSGAGILMSADVCRRLIEGPVDNAGADDESIGAFLMSQGVPMHSEARYNITFDDSETILTGYYHYRAKHPDLSRRNEEPAAMKRILSLTAVHS